MAQVPFNKNKYGHIYKYTHKCVLLLLRRRRYTLNTHIYVHTHTTYTHILRRFTSDATLNSSLSRNSPKNSSIVIIYDGFVVRCFCENFYQQCRTHSALQPKRIVKRQTLAHLYMFIVILALSSVLSQIL